MRDIDTGDRDAGIFDGEGARMLTIDDQGVVVRVELIDGSAAGSVREVSVSLADLLAREDLPGALDDVRGVLECRTSRFVTWTVSEGDSFRPYAGWLHANGGRRVVGVLRWFGI